MPNSVLFSCFYSYKQPLPLVRLQNRPGKTIGMTGAANDVRTVEQLKG